MLIDRNSTRGTCRSAPRFVGRLFVLVVAMTGLASIGSVAGPAEPVMAATVSVTVDCGNGDGPGYSDTGFTIPSRGIIPGNNNNGFTNTQWVSITTADVLSLTYTDCISSFTGPYAGQESGVFTEDCGTFSPTPPSGNVTGQTITLTYTPLATPVNSRDRDYCDGPSGSGRGDHIQYLADLSPQLTILVAAASPDVTAPTLTSSTPADDATGVARDANVVLNFSESVSAVAAKNLVIKKSSDNATVESISVTDGSKVSVSGSAVTVNPSVMLDYLTGYYVTIDAGAFVDSAGNSFAGISSSTALNFTVESPVTTTSAPSTTVAPSAGSSVPPSETVVAPPPTTVTSAPGANPSATTTTVQSRASGSSTLTVPSVVGSTTTSTTSTTTTLVTVPVAPDAPEIRGGESTALVDGVTIPLTVGRSGSVVTVTGAGLTVKIFVRDSDGADHPLDADGNLNMVPNGLIMCEIVGLQANTGTAVWVFSDPLLLGEVIADDSGRLEARFPVPDQLEGGRHRLVLESTNYSGKKITIAVGASATVVSGGGGVSLSGVLVTVLVLAGIGALVLPARRRRRAVPGS